MIVGTAGHIDHGKTSLVQRLTGVDTDRLKEEKARGITIVLGFAYWPQPDGQIVGFIDVPGHEKFVHTMLAGASGIDLLLLAVAADDGVMPQTREHIDIARLLGIGTAVVAITKSDLVDEARLAQVRAEIDGLLAGTAFADASIIPVSTVTGAGIAELAARLGEHARAAQMRRSDGAFRLAVDRCFTLPGAGTVVTGTVLSGKVTVGDSVTVSPAGIAARIRSLHAQNRPCESGSAGERCALNLAGPGISKDAIHRGDMIVARDLHAPTARIDAEFTLLASERKRLPMWLPVRLHHASVEVGARIVLLGEEIEPGATAAVQLVLESPIAAAALDRFVLRDTTASRTIGGGRFLDLRAPERHRRSPQRLDQLRALSGADDAEALEGLLAAPPYHADLAAFARDRALGPGGADRLAAGLGLARLGAWVMLPQIWEGFSAGLRETLKTYHADHPDVPGMGLERLRLVLDPRLPAPRMLERA